jgi:tetratricopeptide (TPR) repeat protein
MFPLKLQSDEEAAIPLPGFAHPSRAETEAAIPLPGTSNFGGLTAAQPETQGDEYWDRQETRVIPGGQSQAAAEMNFAEETAIEEASDGASNAGSYDASRNNTIGEFEIADEPGPDFSEPGFEEAVPLPGSGLFAEPPPPAHSDAIPLPGISGPDLFADFEDPAPQGLSAAEEGSNLFDAPSEDFGSPLDTGAVPLPGRGLFAPPPPPPETLHHTPEAQFDNFGGVDVDSFPPAPSATAMGFDEQQFEEVEYDTESTRVAELKMPGEAFPSLDDEPRTAVRESPIPSAAYKPFPAAPPPKQSNPAPPMFDDLPSPIGSDEPEVSEVEFADADLLPSPASSARPMEGLPSPAETRSPLEDFDPLPSPASGRTSADFGDVDFSDPGPADPLEFDPSGLPPPAPDALEADLNQPLPTPPATSGPDGLEMLDFIDSASQAAGPSAQAPRGKRFHVRRRNGKVFGPFDEPTILSMLEENQLQGNEDVSTDADAWTAIGTVPAFSAAIQRILSTPKTQTTRALVAPALDTLKQKYENRMAVRTTRPARADVLQFVKERLPLVIGGVLGTIALLVGFGLGATRYGVFANKKLFPATIRRGSPEGRELDAARAGILADNFVSYKEARDRAAKLLHKREYPEARAVWDQAIFYLQRRYASSTPAELSTATASLEDIKLLGEKEPEIVKAEVGDALTHRHPDEALALLQPFTARADGSDPEFLFLLAEAYVQKEQVKSAQDALKRALGHKADAKAHHALGDLSQSAGNADAAAKEYQAALTADTRHAQSAVELAAVELLLRKHEERGLDALDKALDETNQIQLGPAQRARAHALRGYALAMQFKPTEALVELQQAEKLDPSSSFTRLALARTYLTQRNYEKALPLLKGLQDAEPDNLDATEGYLTAMISVGKLTEALNLLNQANRRFPGNARGRAGSRPRRRAGLSARPQCRSQTLRSAIGAGAILPSIPTHRRRTQTAGSRRGRSPEGCGRACRVG